MQVQIIVEIVCPFNSDFSFFSAVTNISSTVTTVTPETTTAGNVVCVCVCVCVCV